MLTPSHAASYISNATRAVATTAETRNTFCCPGLQYGHVPPLPPPSCSANYMPLLVKRQAMDRSGAPHGSFGRIKFRPEIMNVSSFLANYPHGATFLVLMNLFQSFRVSRGSGHIPLPHTIWCHTRITRPVFHMSESGPLPKGGDPAVSRT